MRLVGAKSIPAGAPTLGPLARRAPPFGARQFQATDTSETSPISAPRSCVSARVARPRRRGEAPERRPNGGTERQAGRGLPGRPIGCQRPGAVWSGAARAVGALGPAACRLTSGQTCVCVTMMIAIVGQSSRRPDVDRALRFASGAIKPLRIIINLARAHTVRASIKTMPSCVSLLLFSS